MAKRFFTPIDLTGTVNENNPAPERSIKWSDGEGTVEVGLKGGEVKLSIGQEEVALCYNGTGNAVYKGQVVYINGAQGQRPRIALSSASSESTSSKTFGVVTETINNGLEGFVCTFGIVKGINTSSFSEGAALWLSTSSGQITSTMPTAPNHSVFIGYCIRSHATSGQIFVKIQNGYELEELHNVLITSPVTGQSIKYDSTTGLWTNQNVEGGVFEVFYQPGSPTSPQLGDIWVDSDESVPEYDALTINNLLPNQSGNSNKFLQTNGTSTSWQNVNLSLYAPLLDPTFTGTPTAPTASPNTDTTQIATTAFVQAAAIAAAASLIDSAPTTLDTLNELAAALGDDANFATTISTALGGKEPTISTGTTSQYWRGDKSFQTLDKAAVGLGNVENTALSTWAGSSSITTLGTIGTGVWQGTAINASYIDSAIARLESPTFTGTVVLPSTTSIGTVSSTEISYLDGATSAIQTQINNKAPLASPTFTGTADAERLSVDSTAYIDTITTTVSSASATDIDSFVQSLFSSCEYLIQIKQGSKVTVLKALMTSLDLDIVQYGIVESGGTIPYTITTDSFIPSGEPVTNKLRIEITDANVTSATVKVVRTSVV
jgi:hypothetical protein